MTKLAIWKLLLYFLLYVTCITASSLVLDNDACSTYDSCRVSEFFRTCSCHNDCSRYGTCCYDASSYHKMQFHLDTFNCYSSKVPQPVYAKRTCSNGYRGNNLIRNLCVKRNDDTSDLMANVLVFSNKTKTNYWNYNCARCNGESDANLSFWTIQATFPLESGNRRLDITHIRNNMMYHAEENKWGIMHEGEFIPTSLDFFQPPSYMEFFRYCTDGIITSCMPDWDEHDVQRKCRAYYGERRNRITGKIYQNVHCAICNAESLSDLECSGRSYMPKRYSGNITMIRVVFNLNSWTGEHTKGYLPCRSKYRYDPFFRQCRSTKCAIVHPNLNQDVCSAASTVMKFMSMRTAIFVFIVMYLIS